MKDALQHAGVYDANVTSIDEFTTRRKLSELAAQAALSEPERRRLQTTDQSSVNMDLFVNTDSAQSAAGSDDGNFDLASHISSALTTAVSSGSLIASIQSAAAEVGSTMTSVTMDEDASLTSIAETTTVTAYEQVTSPGYTPPSPTASPVASPAAPVANPSPTPKPSVDELSGAGRSSARFSIAVVAGLVALLW